MMMKQTLGMRRSFAFALAALLIALSSGCATKGAKPSGNTTVGANGPGSGNPNDPGHVDDIGLAPYDQSATIFGPDGKGLATIRFDFDSAEIRPDARAILEENAAKINADTSGRMIQIAGHCDERGTQEYNLALGERRALAVREYLMRLNVPGDRLTTISYGEEVPEIPASDESAFATNRRGVFHAAQ